MTPAQALSTATTTGAALLGHEKDLGQIAVKWVLKDGKVVVDKRER